MKVAAMVCLGVVLFVGVFSPSAADPIRTLVYQFSVDGRGFGGALVPGDNEIDSADIAALTSSRTGRITVQVEQATQDGGLVVDVGESIDREPRPLQTIRCAIYGATTDVVCDQNVGATTEETVLLTYLGRTFFDPSKVDAQGHWRTVPRYNHGTVSITNDFTVKQQDGGVLSIDVDREERNGDFRATSKGIVGYDAALGVADSVRLAIAAARTGGQADMNIALTLESDSMAKTGSQNPH